MSTKLITITGYVTEPKEKTLDNGKRVANFGINNGNNELKDWHNFSLWEDGIDRADLHKGDWVTVTAEEYVASGNDGEKHRRWAKVQVVNHTARISRGGNNKQQAESGSDDDLPF